ncbi:MAG: ABC transporter substrate-binding protein [Acidimicrobiales bacterium]
MRTTNAVPRLVRLILSAGFVALGLLAISPAGATTASTPTNTITFAEQPGAAPNYIFPYMACQYFSGQNLIDFQYLTYRPAYWFGTPGSSAVDYSLSSANPAKFSNANKTVTIDMKGWKFADGQTVDAQSVMFFLNLYKANPTSYCGYNPGYGIPDQVASAKGSGNTVTITFTTSVNPNWILYNYLSEITPLPSAWDVTAPGKSSTCATGAYGAKSTEAACKKVQTYLDNQATKITSFNSKFWTSGADGPWKLSQIDDLGDATFVPNATYSGPVKAQPGIKYVKEEAFSSDTAEQNALEAGSINVGYVDPTILSANAPKPGVAGANWPQIASKYTLTSGPGWGFDYTVINFGKKNPKSTVISQLYVRQALQKAINQSAIIKTVDKGYAFPIDSPLPPETVTSISGLPTTAGVANPYPYNLKAAKKLLTSHGWSLNAKHVMACTSPGSGAKDCGAGIAKGTTLNFTIAWASGTPSENDTFNAEVADWDSIGFNFTTSEASISPLISSCSAGGTWEFCSWDDTWGYDPDYYPSGETLFTPTGGFNPGAYNNPTMTTDIKATTFGTATLAKYATYAAQQLPVLYEPLPATTNEYSKSLKSLKVRGVSGFVQNPMGDFMPEYFHY